MALVMRSGVAGMRRQEVRRARIDVRALGAEPRVEPHRGEEALGAIGIEAGARGNADADAVGLEFLRAREARQRDLRFGERQRAELRIAEQVGGDAADQRGLARLVLADHGVAGDHVRHLVRQHRGELGIVVGKRDQAARHVELAVGSAKALTAGELSMVTWYFRSGRSDAATSLSTVCVEHGLQAARPR